MLPTCLLSCAVKHPQGQKLTQVINTEHENPKYLPGIALGSNTIAEPDLEATVSTPATAMQNSIQPYESVCQSLILLPRPVSEIQQLRMSVSMIGCELVSAVVVAAAGEGC